MLLGEDFHVYINHKNLTFNTLKTQRVLSWRTKIEEFSPMLHYIEGPHKILANDLSRLHYLVTLDQIAEGKKLVEPSVVSNNEEDKVYLLDLEHSDLHNNKLWECIECYLILPKTPHPDQNPLYYSHIHELQQKDEQLLPLQEKYPNRKLSYSIEMDFYSQVPASWKGTSNVNTSTVTSRIPHFWRCI